MFSIFDETISTAFFQNVWSKIIRGALMESKFWKMQLVPPELRSISGNIIIASFSGRCLLPVQMFSIKPFQLGRCPSRAAFLKLMGLCHNISTARSDENNGSLLIRSLIPAVNFWRCFKCWLGTPMQLYSNFLCNVTTFITFSSPFILSSIIFFSI